MNGAPGPLIAFCGALTLLALTTTQLVVLVVLAVGAAVLLWRSPGPSWTLLVAGTVSGVFFLLLNPFVAVEGDTIVVSGPSIPILDLEVTVEELAYGAASGLRLAAVTFATGIFLLRCDPDRLTALAARVAPRSALAVALGARLFPTLVRDGGALADAARARGLTLDAGSRRDRARARAVLVAPLLATGLERGLETAEAMTARGYGAGRRTRLAPPRLLRVERALLGPALLLVAAMALLAQTGTRHLAYYDTLGDPFTAPALGAAGLTAAALVVAGLILAQWPSRR